MLAGMEFEEDVLQEDSFQDGQPIVQPREAEGRRILADIHSLEGGEISFSIFSSSSCGSCSSTTFISFHSNTLHPGGVGLRGYLPLKE